MKKIYALWVDVDPQELLEIPTGILIDDGVRQLSVKGKIVTHPRTGRKFHDLGRFVGIGFLSKLWTRKESEEWLKEHFPHMKIRKWLEIEGEHFKSNEWVKTLHVEDKDLSSKEWANSKNVLQ